VHGVVRSDDFVIAADNGAAHCKRLGLTPHIIIGDMDSIEPILLAEYEKKGAQIIRHPVEKNETDLELALSYAKTLGANELVVFGIAGDRWDMTLANALMLARSSLKNISVHAFNDDEELIVIHPGAKRTISGSPGDTVSIIPLTEQVESVTIEGFRYPLKNENLSLGSGRGVSNILLASEGTVTLKKGGLLCIITRRTTGDS